MADDIGPLPGRISSVFLSLAAGNYDSKLIRLSLTVDAEIVSLSASTGI